MLLLQRLDGRLCVQRCALDRPAAFRTVRVTQSVRQTLENGPSVFGMRGMFLSQLQEKTGQLTLPLPPPTQNPHYTGVTAKAFRSYEG